MNSGPPKTVEALVAVLVPPACREEVLGDLHERYRSTRQYGLDAASTVPVIILSRIQRTADSQALLIQAFAFYVSFLFAAWLNGAALLRDEWGLVRLAAPAAVAMVGVLLADAYASPRSRPSPKLSLGPILGAGLALLSQGLLWLFSPDLALPRWTLFFGCGAGLLLSSAVRILFPRPHNDKDKDYNMSLLKFKGVLVGAILVSGAAVLWVADRDRAEPKLTYSQFVASVESGQVASVTITGSNSGAHATGRLTDGSTVRTILPADYGDALRVMQEKQVSVEIRDITSDPLRLLINTTPFFVLLAAWFFMMRRLRNGPRQGLMG
jgi:hypothetical protein